MDFKSRVFAMYKERIANGVNPEAACSFSSTDFPGLNFDDFKAERENLDTYGYIKKIYTRGFTLSDDAIDEINDEF